MLNKPIPEGFAAMLVKVNARRQVTLPVRVLEALGVKLGDRIWLEEGLGGYVLRTRKVDLSRLAPLRGRLRNGKAGVDLESFRGDAHDLKLRT